mmetsp:Transcript_21441/g.29798  ORF Transcript_21441/g.29798 Transcript_21441/m.29798 type:complete len:272 (-) Transcript_21441:174-989(-)
MRFPTPLYSGDCSGKHTSALIFLHGVGDTSTGWSRKLHSFCRRNSVKVICPLAPKQPINLYLGSETVAWFNLPFSWFRTNIFTKFCDEEGVNSSINHIRSLIGNEIANGIDPKRIILGGFSQGGCVALRAALTFPKELGGVIAISAFLGPIKDYEDGKLLMFNRRMPVFWTHGENDYLVPIEFGREGAETLEKAGMRVLWKSYPEMGHRCCRSQLDHIKQFALQILAGHQTPRSYLDGNLEDETPREDVESDGSSFYASRTCCDMSSWFSW